MEIRWDMEMRNDERRSVEYKIMKVSIYIRVSTEDQAKEAPHRFATHRFVIANLKMGTRQANLEREDEYSLEVQRNPYRFVTRSFATTKQVTGTGANLSIGILASNPQPRYLIPRHQPEN